MTQSLYATTTVCVKGEDKLHDICNMFVWRHINSSYSQYVQDTVSAVWELLSVKSSCMDLSILSDSDTDFCIHQLRVL